MRKKIKLDVYSCNVHFILAENFDKVCASIYKKSNEKYDEEVDSAEGTVICFDMSNYYLVINKKYLSNNTISHEIYHLVREILKDRGVEDDEAGAWLCGMFTEHAMKFFYKKPKACLPQDS
jgi:hypothetical protein